MPKRKKSKSAKSSGSPQSARQRQERALQERARKEAGERSAVVPGSAGQAQNQTVSRPEEQPERWFVDISAVRIQEWLARTPDLKFRRGASILLRETTARGEREKRLPAGAGWNDEAGSVDGVVSLVMADDAQDRAAAAREVAGDMRRRMPSLYIQAVEGRGRTYVEAYEGMARARRDGDLLIDLPPAPAEVMVAKPCDQCRSATAVHEKIVIIEGEPTRDLCEDCRQRFDAAGGTKGDRAARSPEPERRMKEALEPEPHNLRVKGFSDHFAAMAEGGRFRKNDAATQVALIAADGNRVGDFLHRVAERAVTKKGRVVVDKRDIVRLIDDATIGALADAVAGRFGGWERPHVLAHIAGGDDLLISVPAPDAWLFTQTLLASFGEKTSEEVKKWQADVGDAPTLSAGLVFAHKMHPFSDLVRMAGAELANAKKHGDGKAAVSFLDLTADGDRSPGQREPVTLAYLDRHAGHLAGIEKIPRSRRESLLALLRRGDQRARDGVGQPYKDVIRRLTDLDGNQPLWDAVTGKKDAGPEETRQKLASEETALADLRRLLDIARHWQAEPRDENRANREAAK